MFLDHAAVIAYRAVVTPGRDGVVEPQFEIGEIIVYRQVREGRVMLAIPLRVVDNTAERTVLYQVLQLRIFQGGVVAGRFTHFRRAVGSGSPRRW